MRGKVYRAEHLGKIAGKRLRLVTTGEDRETVWIGGADQGETLRRDGERLLPLDLLEFARATRAHTLERLAQPCRGQHVHDPGRSLAAQHTAVHRVVTVTFDVAEPAVPQMNLDAAAAGAHVARGIYGLITDRLRIFNIVF